MGTEWIGGGAIGIVLGAIITGIFSVVTRKYQMRDEREKLQLESSIAFNKSKLDKLASRREELFRSLQNLRFGFSTTQNYRMDQANVSYEDYEIHYEKMNQIALRAQLLAYLYFPELIQEVSSIYDLTNIIWGQQQNYFGYSKESNQDRQMILDNIVLHSSDLGSKCLSIMKSIAQFNHAPLNILKDFERL